MFLADLDHIPISSCFFVVCSSNYCNSYIYILLYYSFRSLSPILPILSYFHTIILVYFLTGKTCPHCPMFVAKASCQAVAALHACVGPWVRVANNIWIYDIWVMVKMIKWLNIILVSEEFLVRDVHKILYNMALITYYLIYLKFALKHCAASNYIDIFTYIK